MKGHDFAVSGRLKPFLKAWFSIYFYETNKGIRKIEIHKSPGFNFFVMSLAS
jgi:hypothetical protein